MSFSILMGVIGSLITGIPWSSKMVLQDRNQLEAQCEYIPGKKNGVTNEYFQDGVDSCW